MSNVIHVVYNASTSTLTEQQELHALLPIAHEYGDRSAILADGRSLQGRQQHDTYVSPDLRIKTRKRCTIVPLVGLYMGSGISQVQLETPLNILCCFTAISDWHASGLDAETFFLRPLDPNDTTHRTNMLPRIGPYLFNFPEYVRSMYEDLVMSITSVRNVLLVNNFFGLNKRAHLKIFPLGVGPTIKTRYGEYLGPLLIPSYLLALQYACNLMIDESWCETLEFVDHTYGQLSPSVSVRKVRIMSGVSRDAFDFTNTTGIPTVIAPCDSFCRIGGSNNDKTLASTIANNSNLRDILQNSTIKFIEY
jgi:hypothetical protein